VAVYGGMLAQGVVYLLAKAGLTASGQSAGILAVLVFGAGTDYALLLIARDREELRRHEDKHEAMTLAMHRAGPAVLASGATVTIGLLCLLVAELNSTSGLGPVGAAVIVCALAATTSCFPPGAAARRVLVDGAALQRRLACTAGLQVDPDS